MARIGTYFAGTALSRHWHLLRVITHNHITPSQIELLLRTELLCGQPRSPLLVTFCSSFCFWLLLPLGQHQPLLHSTVRWAAEMGQVEAEVDFGWVWPHSCPSTAACTREQLGIWLEGDRTAPLSSSSPSLDLPDKIISAQPQFLRQLFRLSFYLVHTCTHTALIQSPAKPATAENKSFMQKYQVALWINFVVSITWFPLDWQILVAFSGQKEYCKACPL